MNLQFFYGIAQFDNKSMFLHVVYMSVITVFHSTVQNVPNIIPR